MNFLILFLIIFVGVFSGIITGMLPGIHINMISLFILINLKFLLSFFDVKFLIIYIIVMGVVHSFVDFIPSILFGIPNPDTSLSVLPAHRMVLNGKGYFAIFLSAMGSLFGMFFSFLILPLFYFGVKHFYSFFKIYIPFLLIFVIIFLILGEKNINKIFFALLVVLFSGGLGILVLNSDFLFSPLLVLFSGIFGVSNILNSFFSEYVDLKEQDLTIDFDFNFNFLKSIFIGGVSASVCSISPGLGNSQAASISSIFFKNINQELFIVTTSAINTINFILSIFTLYLIGKARNGAIFIVSQLIDVLTIKDILLYFMIVFFVSFIGFFLTLFLGKKIINSFFKLNFKVLNLFILILISLVVFIVSGFYGLLVLIVSSFLGYFTILIGVRRIHLMSILIIPIIFNLL